MPKPGNTGPKKWTTSDPYGSVNLNADPIPAFLKNYKTFEGWFNYLFADCTNADRKKYYELVLTPEGALKPPYNDASNHAVRKKVLTEMLKAGFEEYTGAKFFGSGDDLLKPLKGTVDGIRVGFRGELRPPAMVQLHNGCKSRALVEPLKASMGMNEPWHPFSEPGASSKAYFRKGFNKDNCLFTTVSVATDFMTASKFPLLADLRKDEPDAIGTATVIAKGLTSSVKAMAAKMEAQISGIKGIKVQSPLQAPGPSVKGEVRLLHCVRMNVYIFRVDKLWNTEAKQSSLNAPQFPERAASEIPFSNFIARVRCDRIQFGEDSNDGHQLIIQGYDLLHTPTFLKKRLGDIGFSQIEAFLKKMVQDGMLRPDGTGGIRYATDITDKAIQIEKVERIDARRAWL